MSFRKSTDEQLEIEPSSANELWREGDVFKECVRRWQSFFYFPLRRIRILVATFNQRFGLCLVCIRQSDQEHDNVGHVIRSVALGLLSVIQCLVVAPNLVILFDTDTSIPVAIEKLKIAPSSRTISALTNFNLKPQPRDLGCKRHARNVSL